MGGTESGTDIERDPLTGLPVINEVRDRLRGWLDDAAEGGEAPHVHAGLIGLRRFENINLAFGDHAGDSALAEVALRIDRFLDHEMDGEWLLARAGGGNFLYIMRGKSSRERWQWLAEELAGSIARPIYANEGVLRVSPRIALLRAVPEERVRGMLDVLSTTLEELQREQTLRVQWAKGETATLGRSNAELEADLLRAIELDEIEICFQPQYSLTDNALVGAEALARWEHGEVGHIGASALFTIAERADHVAPLTQHIAKCAMKFAQDWPKELRLSVNVSPIDLADRQFADQLAAIILMADFPAERLTVEVTEHTMLGDLSVARANLERLQKQGIGIAADDFGAGFCNFRYLKVLPVDTIKLDRSMVEGIEADPRDLAVLRGIVAMAKALDLKVVVEGVETETVRELLADEGCDIYQGFLGGKPMSAQDFLKLATD